VTPRRLIEPARLAGSALLHTQSDERLVDLARAGNDRAFEAVVTRYRRPLLRYCRRLLPPERAEDAVQQTFLNAYRAIGAGEAELNLKPWLYRIAHNASISLLRQNGWTHEQLDEQFDGVEQPPQAVENSERMREVVRAVKQLPERQRDAVVLRELEGRSYEEIAVTLGVSGGAVRQLLNRARTNLRAAATAVTPFEIAGWAAARGPTAVPAGERIAELCTGAGAGGLAAAAKLGTALVVAGAVAGGATGAGPLPDVVRGEKDAGTEQAVATEAAAVPGGGARGVGASGSLGSGAHHGPDSVSRSTGAEKGHTSGDGSGRDSSRSGSDERSGSGDHELNPDDYIESSGPGSGDDRSGSDSSGSGSSGSGSGDSGDRSGSGSGDSGSGSSGSDSSGSGDDGSGSSGSGSSGSDSSGSGSGDSGSGSSGSGSGTGGSGTSGSGHLDD
jgi:RNA polymerase sigma factor (sigma-70 family)